MVLNQELWGLAVVACFAAVTPVPERKLSSLLGEEGERVILLSWERVGAAEGG